MQRRRGRLEVEEEAAEEADAEADVERWRMESSGRGRDSQHTTHRRSRGQSEGHTHKTHTHKMGVYIRAIGHLGALGTGHWALGGAPFSLLTTAAQLISSFGLVMFSTQRGIRCVAGSCWQLQLPAKPRGWQLLLPAPGGEWRAAIGEWRGPWST
jgi:hypothetical protein